MPRPLCYGTAPSPHTPSRFWPRVVVGLVAGGFAPWMQQIFAPRLGRTHPSWDAATAAASGVGTRSQSRNAPVQPTASPKPEGDSFAEASDSMKMDTCSRKDLGKVFFTPVKLRPNHPQHMGTCSPPCLPKYNVSTRVKRVYSSTPCLPKYNTSTRVQHIYPNTTWLPRYNVSTQVQLCPKHRIKIRRAPSTTGQQFG